MAGKTKIHGIGKPVSGLVCELQTLGLDLVRADCRIAVALALAPLCLCVLANTTLFVSVSVPRLLEFSATPTATLQAPNTNFIQEQLILN